MSKVENNSTAKSMPPAILYGTAWKENNTEALTFQALNAGFIGIDTANQRKHYFEKGVGLGIQQYLKTSGKTRQDLFLQTKFTSAHGQDHRKPYNEADSYTEQVRQSFASSLLHLQTNYIDSYLLHGPQYQGGELVDEDWEIWKAMENLCHEKQVKYIGISNVDILQLEMLYKYATVKPAFVQNRCFAVTQWDKSIRDFCAKHHIVYQGFSLLTANHPFIISPFIQSLATRYEKTIPQIIFRLARDFGILPLTGTTNQQHMQDDLNIDDFQLTADELRAIEMIHNREFK